MWDTLTATINLLLEWPLQSNKGTERLENAILTLINVDNLDETSFPNAKHSAPKALNTVVETYGIESVYLINDN